MFNKLNQINDKKILNIAIFGNINNYPLRLALALNSYGHNIKLILNSKEALHRPEFQYPNLKDNIPKGIEFFDFSYIEEIDYISESQTINKVINVLNNDTDFVILNDFGPSLYKYILAPYLVFLTGSDLSYLANFKSIELRTKSWSNTFKLSDKGLDQISKIRSYIKRQREGIYNAKLIYHMEKGLLPKSDILLKQIGVKKDKIIFYQMSNLRDLDYLEQPQNNILTLISGARVNFKNRWKHSSESDMKGTNILLKGFSKFIRKGNKANLRLFEKGQDLKEAKDIISKLKIEKNITWIKESSLSQFYKEISKADLICDQFANAFPGLVTLDAYAIGRPVLANFRNEVFRNKYIGGLPGFDVKTSDDIYKKLVYITNNPKVLKSKGKESRLFAEKNLCPKIFARFLIDIIN